MDFDLVFVLNVWNDEERQAVSKEISFSYNFLGYIAKTMKKTSKNGDFGQAEKNIAHFRTFVLDYYLVLSNEKYIKRSAWMYKFMESF